MQLRTLKKKQKQALVKHSQILATLIKKKKSQRYTMANVLVYHSNTKDYREYEQLHSNKLYNLEEMDKFRETQNLPRVNHKEIANY